MKKATKKVPAEKAKPKVMLISVNPQILEDFRKKVTDKIGIRQMSPLIVSWMKEYINEP